MEILSKCYLLTYFSDEKRELVINYVKEKYGVECVSKIITFGTLAARAVINDVGRVLNLPASHVKNITKAIPQDPNMTIKKALETSPEFADLYELNDINRNLIDIARKLEGLPRNTSVHACGLLITPHAVSEYIPQTILEDEHGVAETVTQYNMVECEEMGCLKMDVRTVH